MQKAIIFLHIPKTAGQSVHRYLQQFFQPDEVCPARENFQLLPFPTAQLQQFRLFSGHLDWSLLDAVHGPRFAFTILRDPIERLLSFYFFLRTRASRMKKEELLLPQHQGLKAALTLSPDSYFCDAPGHLRQFLDNHYDNFYTYYFAGRTFDARQKLKGAMLRNTAFNEKVLLDLALANMRVLDQVYTTEQLDRLETRIEAELGAAKPQVSLVSTRVNQGEGDFNSRLDKLRAIGATDRTFERLRDFTKLDDAIWKQYSP